MLLKYNLNLLLFIIDFTLSRRMLDLSFNPKDKLEFDFFFMSACNFSVFSLLSNFINSTSGSYLSHLEYEASSDSL